MAELARKIAPQRSPEFGSGKVQGTQVRQCPWLSTQALFEGNQSGIVQVGPAEVER